MTPTLLTPDDLLAMPDGDGYELLDGIPVEKNVGAQSDEIALGIGSFLRDFVLTHKLGRVFGSQTGYRCFPNRPIRVRRPDVSVVLHGRLPNGVVPEGDISIPPDLAVEVISPNDTFEEIEEKVADYFSAGVKLVWIVSPKSRTVLVRRPDNTAAVVPESGELVGESVIPGFACKVANLFV